MCVDSIIEGIKKGFKEGIKIEKNNFMKCMLHSNARGLMGIFFCTKTM